MNLCSSKEQCTMQCLLIIPVDHSNSVHKNINRITEPKRKKNYFMSDVCINKLNRLDNFQNNQIF